MNVQTETTPNTPTLPTEGEQAPEVELTPNEAETPEEESPEQQEGTPAERDEKGRFKSGVQPRIDELTRARREAEREASYWKQVAQGTQSPAQAAPQRPVPENYDKYDDYIDALTDWKAEKAIAKHMEADSTRKVTETRVQTFAERQTQARAELTDYDTVVGGSDTPISDHVRETVMESDLGPHLAYHFAKNPAVLERLNSMSPTAAAREIGRLEATLNTKPAAPTKKVSATPAPAGTLGNQGRATTPTLANASMEEYKAMRKSQGASWAR